MCVHINTLPDDCLLPIFDRISLLELLCLDQICPRWSKLLPSAAVRRRSLVLVLGGRRVESMEWHIPFNNTFDVSFNGRKPFYYLSEVEREASLTLQRGMSLVPQRAATFDEFLLDDAESEGFFDILYRSDGHSEEDFTERARFKRACHSGDLFAYFAELLPNVKKLVVIHTRCYEEELFSLIDFLVSSPWSLVVLKLWLRFPGRINHNYSDIPHHHPVRTLLQTIASRQSSLQQLTVDLEEAEPELPIPEQVFTLPAEVYSFISRLKVAKLYLEQYNEDDLIWNIAHRFDSPVLSEISFGKDDKFSMEVALNRRFKFTHKVRQLYHWDMEFESAEQFDQFCCRFASLTMLGMVWSDNITFTRLVSNLSLLRQLTHLKLCLSMQYPANPFALVDGDKEETRRISLPQVKIFEFYITSRSHQDLESLCPLMFPSVEVIIVANYPECTICGLNNNGPYDHEVANRCHQSLIRPLRNKFSSFLVRLYAELSYGRRNRWIEYVHTEDEVGA